MGKHTQLFRAIRLEQFLRILQRNPKQYKMMYKHFIIAISALLLTTLSIRATAHTIEPNILFDKHTTMYIRQYVNAKDNSVEVPKNPLSIILGQEYLHNENPIKNCRMNRRQTLSNTRNMNLPKKNDISWRETYDNLLWNVNSIMKHKEYSRSGQWTSIAEITTDRFNGICIFRLYF